jgi:translation initiation factor 3 subunit D
VLRTQLDAALKTPAGDTTYVNVRALNEFDPRASSALDWRSKLDGQRGAVLATEMKNNSSKLARWATESYLSGAETLKLAFVSRISPKDPSNHTILTVQSFRPRDLAQQMNMSLANGWGIVKTIVDICFKLDDGKYILVKDPNKAIVRLYGINKDNVPVGSRAVVG